jgi:hypothetical protein
MDWKRHLGSAAVLAAFLAFNTATSKAPSGSSGGSSGGSGTSTVTGKTSSAPDLDIGNTSAALGCVGGAAAGGKKSEGCRVLNDFVSAGPLADLPTSGEKVWVGYSYAVGGSGDGKREYFFLQLKPGRTSPLAPLPDDAALDISGAARSLLPENPAEERDTGALVTALRAGSPAPAGNAAAAFVRTARPPDGYRSVVRTTGASVAIMSPGPLYAYIRKIDNRVLVIEYDGNLLAHKSGGAQAKAWCSELWALP